VAVCDARSVSQHDLLEADAVFDVPGKPEWSFEGLVLRYSPRHRWSYFSNMTSDEAIVFKTNDSDPAQRHHVPHSARQGAHPAPGTGTVLAASRAA
jgi:hypothetical protein